MQCTECFITFLSGVRAAPETYFYQCETPLESPSKDELNVLKKLKFSLKMARKIGDSEKHRQIDRIMNVAFRIARDAGANFINRKWVAEKLGRSVQWVTDHWNKSPQECSTQFGEKRLQQLSQENQDIVAELSNK